MSELAIEVLQFGLGLVPFARPYQWNLDFFFGIADRVRIYSGGASGGRILKGAKLICEVTFPETREIRQALRLDGLKASPRCLCLGSIAIELWRGEMHLTTLALHHNRTLRLSGLWPLDAVLRDGAGLARWLAEHGHPEVFEEHLQALRSHQEREEDARLFFRQTPPRLQDLAHTSVALSTLNTRYRDSIELCQDLLRWFGCARRCWDKLLPPHEDRVAETLKALGPEVLVTATLASAGDPQILYGAARYWTLHVKQSDQLLLPESQWRELKADPKNAQLLANTIDRIRRKKLRLSPDSQPALAAPRILADHGPYANLVDSDEQIYALHGSRILNLTAGVEFFNCQDADLTFTAALGEFQIAQAVPGRVIVVGSKGTHIYDRAERQDRPRMVPGNHSYLRAWTDGSLKIRGPMGLLLQSPVEIRLAFLSERYLFWSTDDEVLRLQLDPPGASETLLKRQACALTANRERLISACADGSLWLDGNQIGTTLHRPLALAADDDDIYVLTESEDGTWALEHHRTGVLAHGLKPAASPSLALTNTHLYGTFASEVLAFERLP
ncbi:MAG: hypothetical protein U0931_35475 [Vulcanimicrobiota bacterium]